MTDTDLVGPRSLHWRYGGDNRVLLLLVRAGLLQLMHPGLGAGVREHSDFFGEPWERIVRSVPEIQGVTFDWPEAEATAKRITGYHHTVKGTDEQGRRYHALDPGTYFWAHATIFETMVRAMELFERPFTEAEKERLYQETLAGYRLYGVSMRDVPRDWPAFEAYLDHMCREELEITPVAEGLMGFVDHPPETMPGVPAPLYRLGRKPMGRLLWWVSVGTLHPALRERIGQTWTARDERRLRLFAKVVKAVWTVLPHRLRYSPRSRAAMRRVAAAA
ncbi:oxygenase MpaB family protein [Kutzneria viridogrisea]|uniref:ER-bound oxygenase mpaB/mpaB'/Rubber oxygenase catalytic domain-containing protein n=2 Tax=Kutzneria TaxID=43356 RepID=W5WGX4_9PSEU|nr:oxygenase MpaB family protein [Kutzneria albida]AHI00103.1 hypothetical protein KALB_6744 [Kutzneria albida DSM 43870]MBA8925282.1 uncharacterized protein (DUF2236 family) [Kutzneria viridogrisea]